MNDGSTDPIIVSMISDFIQNGNFRLNWSKYEKMGLSRRRTQRYRRKAMEIYLYFPAIEQKISELKEEVDDRDREIENLRQQLSSFRKSSEDASKVLKKFHGN